MFDHLRKRSLSFIAAVLHLSIICLGAFPGIATAQSVDIEPPVIEFEAIDEGTLGDNQVFGATVLDNVAVSSVKLFYRFSESGQYRSQLMIMLGSSGIYTITIDNEAVPADATFVQYYLEALDGVGNRSLQGFAFDPIERQLVEAQIVAADATTEPVAATGISLNQKIIYGALGLLLVGVLASASGGGGSSTTPGVPVTVVVDQLP